VDRARESARRVICLAGVKHMGLATLDYALDYNGVLPLRHGSDPLVWGNSAHGGNPPLSRYSTGEMLWWRKYLESFKVIKCPSADHERIDGKKPLSAYTVEEMAGTDWYAETSEFYEQPAPGPANPCPPPYERNTYCLVTPGGQIAISDGGGTRPVFPSNKCVAYYANQQRYELYNARQPLLQDTVMQGIDLGSDGYWMAHLNQSNHVSHRGRQWSNYYGTYMQPGRADGGNVAYLDGSAQWVPLAGWDTTRFGSSGPYTKHGVRGTDDGWHAIGNQYNGGMIGSRNSRLMAPGGFAIQDFNTGYYWYTGDPRGMWDGALQELLPGYWRLVLDFSKPLAGEYGRTWNP
jgi:hypothetical protein